MGEVQKHVSGDLSLIINQLRHMYFALVYHGYLESLRRSTQHNKLMSLVKHSLLKNCLFDNKSVYLNIFFEAIEL